MLDFDCYGYLQAAPVLAAPNAPYVPNAPAAPNASYVPNVPAMPNAPAAPAMRSYGFISLHCGQKRCTNRDKMAEDMQALLCSAQPWPTAFNLVRCARLLHLAFALSRVM